MTRARSVRVMAMVASSLLVAAPAVAQDDAAEPMAEPMVVSGVDYAFVGLPTSVPVGTTLAFDNGGVDFSFTGPGGVLNARSIRISYALNTGVMLNSRLTMNGVLLNL